METTTEIGAGGETLAVAYLRGRGYEILCRNFRYRKAEVDIIAKKNGTVVIVEVKTRTGAFYEDLDQSVTPEKIRRLVRAADHFTRSLPQSGEVRFDIIQILRYEGGYRLHHIPDAFYFF